MTENKKIIKQENPLKLKKVIIGKIINPNKKQLNLEYKLINEKKNTFIDNTSNFILNVNSLHLNLKKANLNKKYDIINSEKEKEKLQYNPGELALLESVYSLSSVKAQKIEKINIYDYIQSFLTFNAETASYKIMGYSFNRNNNINKIINEISNILEICFQSISTLISKPIFKLTPDKVIIQLFYYVLKNERNKKILKRMRKRIKNRLIVKKYKGISIYNSKRKSRYFRNKKNKITLRKIKNMKEKTFFIGYYKIHKIFIRILSSILSKIFNKPVEFNLIRLHKPYLDSNILANILGLFSNKIKFRKMINKLFVKAKTKNIKKLNNNNNFFKNKNKNISNTSLSPKKNRYPLVNGGRKRISLSVLNSLPSYLSGIKIKSAGRLLTNRIIPRKTVTNYQKGRLARGKSTLVSKSRFTSKNKRGIFSITVSTGYLVI